MLHPGNYDQVEAFPSSVFEMGVNDVLVPLREDDLLSGGKRPRDFENDELDDDDDDDGIHSGDNLLDVGDNERDPKRARFIHWGEDEDKMLLQLLHDHPYASWRDIGKHFPTRTIAAVKARGALLAKKLPRKSLEGLDHMEDGILENEPSFLKVSHGWTKEDNEKLLDAINKQRGGPRKWGKIAEIFPDRTRKATEVHGMKLLMKVYGTTSTEILDDINLTTLLGKPSRKWVSEEDETIHHILQNMEVIGNEGWEKHIDRFRERTVPELKSRAKYLIRKSEAGIQVLEGHDDDFEGYEAAPSKPPVFIAWSKEEDELLEQLTINLPEGSGRWESVVKMFPGRTRRAVITHARRLQAKKNGGILGNMSALDRFGDSLADDQSGAEDNNRPHEAQSSGKKRSRLSSASGSANRNKLREMQYHSNGTGIPMSTGNESSDSESNEGKELYKVKTLWTFFEEETLLQLMQEYPDKHYDWVEIGKHFPGRTRKAVECHGIKLLRDISRYNRRLSNSNKQTVSSNASSQPPFSISQAQQLDPSQLDQLTNEDMILSPHVLETSITTISGDEDMMQEFRSNNRRPKMMWSQEEEETLLAAMEQYHGKGRWYEIAKLFPGRSKQAIECHGITLQKQIRIKSQKYSIPLPAKLLAPNPTTSLPMSVPSALSAPVPLPVSMSNVSEQDVSLIPQSLENNPNAAIPMHPSFDNMNNTPMTAADHMEALANSTNAAISLMMQPPVEAAISGVASASSNDLHPSEDMTRESLEHLENVLLEATSASKSSHQELHSTDHSDNNNSTSNNNNNNNATMNNPMALHHQGQEHGILDMSLHASATHDPLSHQTLMAQQFHPSTEDQSQQHQTSDSNTVQATIDIYRKVRSIPTSRSKMWSHEEDEALKAAILAVGGHHWSKIASMIPGKSSQQCLGRWRTLNPSISREPWTEEEDETLKALVQRYTVDDKVRWAKVAQHLPGRRDTQCRARWCYNVNPELSTSAWTDEELKIFLLSKHELGNRWSEIEKRLPGRSVNALLSRWHSVKRRLEGFILLKLGVLKEQIVKDVENYDFEKFFPTIEFTEDDAAEMVRVMKAGSFVGYKIAKSRESGADKIGLATLPKIRPSMSAEDQKRLMRAAAATAIMDGDTSESDHFNEV